MLEEERKYAVDARFGVPDLSGCVPDGGEVVTLAPVRLRATYYDTADRRLARAGASLRYRRGDAAPWTVKLPTDVAAVLRTTRRSYELRDADGRLLAELDDDSVAVLDGQKVRFKFREIEVERRDGGRRLL